MSKSLIADQLLLGAQSRAVGTATQSVGSFSIN